MRKASAETAAGSGLCRPDLTLIAQQRDEVQNDVTRLHDIVASSLSLSREESWPFLRSFCPRVTHYGYGAIYGPHWTVSSD